MNKLIEKRIEYSLGRAAGEEFIVLEGRVYYSEDFVKKCLRRRATHYKNNPTPEATDSLNSGEVRANTKPKRELAQGNH